MKTNDKKEVKKSNSNNSNGDKVSNNRKNILDKVAMTTAFVGIASVGFQNLPDMKKASAKFAPIKTTGSFTGSNGIKRPVSTPNLSSSFKPSTTVGSIKPGASTTVGYKPPVTTTAKPGATSSVKPNTTTGVNKPSAGGTTTITGTNKNPVNSGSGSVKYKINQFESLGNSGIIKPKPPTSTGSGSSVTAPSKPNTGVGTGSVTAPNKPNTGVGTGSVTAPSKPNAGTGTLTSQNKPSAGTSSGSSSLTSKPGGTNSSSSGLTNKPGSTSNSGGLSNKNPSSSSTGTQGNKAPSNQTGTGSSNQLTKKDPSTSTNNKPTSNQGTQTGNSNGANKGNAGTSSTGASGSSTGANSGSTSNKNNNNNTTNGNGSGNTNTNGSGSSNGGTNSTGSLNSAGSGQNRRPSNSLETDNGATNTRRVGSTSSNNSTTNNTTTNNTTNNTSGGRGSKLGTAATVLGVITSLGFLGSTIYGIIQGTQSIDQQRQLQEEAIKAQEQLADKQTREQYEKLALQLGGKYDHATGTIILPDGSVMYVLTGIVKHPDGSWTDQNGNLHMPDGSGSIDKDGNINIDGVGKVDKDGNIILEDGSGVIDKDGVFHPSGNISAIKGISGGAGYGGMYIDTQFGGTEVINQSSNYGSKAHDKAEYDAIMTKTSSHASVKNGVFTSKEYDSVVNLILSSKLSRPMAETMKEDGKFTDAQFEVVLELLNLYETSGKI